MYYFYSLFHFLNKLDTFFIAHIVVKVTDGSDKKHLILAPYNNSVVDPGRGRGRQPIIWPNFPDYCIKVKKCGPRGGASKMLLCRSATAVLGTFRVFYHLE